MGACCRTPRSEGAIMHEIVIRGGTIIDGTGAAAFIGDIAVDGGKIAAVGAGFGGSPVAISWLPLGTKLGDMSAAGARILNNVAQRDNESGSLDLTQAGWIRRYAEWVHQQQVLIIEIQQIERQILGTQRRRDQTLHELNTHERQIEQAGETDAFLRDKFTSHALYLFMQRELAGLYGCTFDLALDAARQAERAFNLERGHTSRHFVTDCLWDELREGLTAGRAPLAGGPPHGKGIF